MKLMVIVRQNNVRRLLCRRGVSERVLIFLPLVFSNCVNGQKKSPEKLHRFATIDNGKIVITIDTLKFKKDILEKLITNKKEVVLDKVEVLNQKVIGGRKQSIYFAKVTSTDKKATFSRILVKKGNTLYLNEGSNARSFDLTYLMCQPKDKSDSSAPCNPNVFDIDGQLVWACGDDPKCAAPNASVPCNTFHAVIIP